MKWKDDEEISSIDLGFGVVIGIGFIAMIVYGLFKILGG